MGACQCCEEPGTASRCSNASFYSRTNHYFEYTPSCRTLRSIEIVEGVTLKIIKGMIIDERVDVIVNWANTHLNHGTGISGQIVHNGGSII